MGLFSKKHEDGGRREEHSDRDRNHYAEEDVAYDGYDDPSEAPTRRQSTADGPVGGWEIFNDGDEEQIEVTARREREVRFDETDESRAPEPVIRARPEMPAAQERPAAAAASASPPAAPSTEPRPAGEPDTGSLARGELRAAVTAGPTTTENDADEGRVSADDLIAPTLRRHPFAPEPAEVPTERRMKVFAFANQKGGVAKTTTTLNLAVALKESGHKVLCVDLDPQGNLTMSQGIDPDAVDLSLYHVLVDKVPMEDIIIEREIDIAVASIDLAGAEIAMSTQIGRERSLQKALASVADKYDYVCIDTPPSLGLLTINALTAADKVIVPVQCEYLSMRGLVQLQNTLEMIRENLNPDVQIEGILPTMLDARTVHAKEAIEILEENFGELVFKSRIRKAIKFAEAPVKGSSVLKYDPQSNAAQCYRDLAEEVLTHGTT